MASKLTLSEKEFQLVTNTDWFLTKLAITLKVQELFALLLEKLRSRLDERPGFEFILEQSPKIFKGENYHGLPWVMLDYPRLFSAKEVFALRTMFWWGNYFSVTLHLKGSYKQKLLNAPGFNLKRLQQQHFFVSVHEDEWKHELESPNYIDANELSETAFKETINSPGHLKLAKKVSLTAWDNATVLLVEIYDEMIGLMEDQLPRR